MKNIFQSQTEQLVCKELKYLQINVGQDCILPILA